MALTPMTCASRTSAHAPAFVHFSAINRKSRTRVSSFITGLSLGHVSNAQTAGTGTVRYDKNANSLTYQSQGDTEGAPVDTTADIQGGRLYSGNGVDWIYFDLDSSELPAGIVTDLLGKWELQDNAASTAVVAAIGPAGTLTGAGNTSASTTTGPGTRLTAALAFDGSDDYVQNASAVTPTGEWTICWWGKRDGTTNTDDPVLGTNSANAYIGWSANANSLSIRVTAGGTLLQSVTHGVSGTISSWHHYAFTRDASNIVKLYVDGSLVNSNVFSGAASGSAAWQRIARNHNAVGTVNNAHAKLADVRVYAVEKSAADILVIYNEKDNSPAPPVYGVISDTVTIAATRSTGVVQPTEMVEAGDPDYYSQSYDWYFGDSHAITYSKTNGRSSNRCYPAPNTGHLYTTPGTYTARLRCYQNDGTTVDYEQDITITDQAATASIFYCDSSRPDDSGNGLTPATAKKTFAAALALRTSNSIIRFKRGGSYESTAQVTISHDDVTVTSYYNSDGTDDVNQPRPILFHNSTGNLFLIATTTDRFKLCHFDLSSVGETSLGGAIYLSASGTQDYTLMYDCLCTTFQTMMSSAGTGFEDTHSANVDCHSYDLRQATGGGATSIYLCLDRGAVLGTKINAVVQPLAVEGQCIRIFAADEPVIADSIFEKPRLNVGALALRTPTFADVLKPSMYWSVLRNSVDNGDSTGVGVGISATNGTLDQRQEHGIVFGNEITSVENGCLQFEGYHLVASQNVLIGETIVATVNNGVVPPSNHCQWLNNVFDFVGSSTNNPSALWVDSETGTNKDPLNNVIHGNIFYRGNGINLLHALLIDHVPDLANIDSDYNLHYSPTTAFLDFRTAGPETTVSYTLAQTKATFSSDLNSLQDDPDFVGSGNYRLQASSPAIDAGDDSLLGWLRIDADGKLRTGAVDAGPYEYGASDPGSPVPATGGANRANRLSLRLGVGF